MKVINKYNYIIGVLLLFVLVNLSFSCKKDNAETIPYVPINIYINTSLPQYQTLTSVGGWVYTNGGNKGLIVFRNSIDQVTTYDRYCTYKAPQSCGAGAIDSSNVQISCDCDGSKYSLFDGSITKGPATIPLVRYSTSFDGTIIHITN